MRTLENFAKQNNLELRVVTYTFQGLKIKRKGYDLVRNGNEIVISFEPKQYSDYKWFVRNSYDGYSGASFLERISKEYLYFLSLDVKSFYRLK